MSNNEREIEKRGSKLVLWLKNNIYALFLFSLSIYFIFSGSIKFIANELDWWEKIVFIFTTLIFGVVISSLVAEGGYASGKQDERYVQTRKAAILECEKALPYKKEVELYVSKKIDEDIMEERKEILAKASILYSDIFSENGVVIYSKKNKKQYSFKQRGAIKKAINIKKIPFTLFGFASVKMVGRKEAPNEIKRRNSKIISDFIVRSIMAIASGSVMFAFIGVSIASILYAVFQLAIWYGSGLLSRISNFNFIVNDVREYDQERIWYLKEFSALSEQEKAKLTEEVAANEIGYGIKAITMKQ